MIDIIRLAAALLLAAAGAPSGAAAQDCAPGDIAKVIDDTGARLRKLNSDAQPAFKARLRQLAQRQGWGDAEAESRGYEYLHDGEIQTLDEQAGVLLNKLDRLGDDGIAKGSPCDRLAEARTVAAQLVEVTTAKSAHLAAKLDAALSPAAARPPEPPAAPKSAPKTARQTPPASTVPEPASPQARSRTDPSWQTQTMHHPPGGIAEPGAPMGDPSRLTFTADDISAAGRGFFGTISASLASVIDYAFQHFGQPNGYVLGTEGGAALVAGLRYGKGTLVTKAWGERTVYWQGPSLGADLGLSGSRVMFLVYNLKDPDEVLARFAGVDGSAYVVGGVGLTVLKKGRIVLAPIRTGLGLRLGANVGYVKFTPVLNLNPF